MVEKAINETSWAELNTVLYRFCDQNPRHDNDEIILAKLVLIGRTYAAALERRKKKDPDESADDFYINIAAPALRKSEIDDWIGELPEADEPSTELLPIVLEIHKNLVDLFKEISGQEKRSLASKYLHFHRPNHFFIYDSRTEAAARVWAPQIRRRGVEAASSDEAYHLFFERCLAIVEMVRNEIGVVLTPRTLDNLLLGSPAGSQIE